MISLIAMAGNMTLSYFQRMYDSTPVEHLFQELNLEYWFLPSFSSVSFLSCLVCSVGNSSFSCSRYLPSPNGSWCWLTGCQRCGAGQVLMCTLCTHWPFWGSHLPGMGQLATSKIQQETCQFALCLPNTVFVGFSLSYLLKKLSARTSSIVHVK